MQTTTMTNELNYKILIRALIRLNHLSEEPEFHWQIYDTGSDFLFASPNLIIDRNAKKIISARLIEVDIPSCTLDIEVIEEIDL